MSRVLIWRKWHDAKRPTAPLKHGTRSRYTWGGCRCRRCRAANAAYQREVYRETKIPSLPVDKRPPHGTASRYQKHRCRCRPCRLAANEARWIARQRKREAEAHKADA